MAITLGDSGQNGQTSKKSKELQCFYTGCMLEDSLWNHTCLKLCTSQFVRQEAGALQNLLRFTMYLQGLCLCYLPCPWQYASDKGRSQGTNLGTTRENPSQGTASLPKMGRINLLSRAMAGWMYVSTPKELNRERFLRHTWTAQNSAARIKVSCGLKFENLEWRTSKTWIQSIQSNACTQTILVILHQVVQKWERTPKYPKWHLRVALGNCIIFRQTHTNLVARVWLAEIVAIARLNTTRPHGFRCWAVTPTYQNIQSIDLSLSVFYSIIWR